MEYIILIIIVLFLIILLKIILDINIKKIKNLANNKKLDEIALKFPNNKELCKKYLRKLNNEKVKIEEKDAESSLYIAISDKIIIADLKDNYSRIQTIAHECLHSVQERKVLLFNFFFSNIYILYFIIISILCIFNILSNNLLFICIFIILGLVYYMVRSYLENDAMIKARFLAKEYMEEENIVSQEEEKQLINGFDIINKSGIKCVNYNLLLGIFYKLIIILLICFVRTVAF